MKRKLIFLALLLVAASLIQLGACKKESSGGVEVTMSDNMFRPSSVSIVAGTTVTWINQEDITHTVTSVDGLFESGDMEKGSTFSFTFVKAGIYEYHCTYHNGMKGSVLVK